MTLLMFKVGDRFDTEPSVTVSKIGAQLSVHASSEAPVARPGTIQSSQFLVCAHICPFWRLVLASVAQFGVAQSFGYSVQNFLRQEFRQELAGWTGRCCLGGQGSASLLCPTIFSPSQVGMGQSMLSAVAVQGIRYKKNFSWKKRNEWNRKTTIWSRTMVVSFRLLSGSATSFAREPPKIAVVTSSIACSGEKQLHGHFYSVVKLHSYTLRIKGGFSSMGGQLLFDQLAERSLSWAWLAKIR